MKCDVQLLLPFFFVHGDDMYPFLYRLPLCRLHAAHSLGVVFLNFILSVVIAFVVIAGAPVVVINVIIWVGRSCRSFRSRFEDVLYVFQRTTGGTHTPCMLPQHNLPWSQCHSPLSVSHTWRMPDRSYVPSVEYIPDHRGMGKCWCGCCVAIFSLYSTVYIVILRYCICTRTAYDTVAAASTTTYSVFSMCQ